MSPSKDQEYFTDGLTENLLHALAQIQDPREVLAERFDLEAGRVVARQEAADGTRKFLFALRDGQTVESVIIPMENHATFCISSQVGCAMACRFCATARGGLVRSLTPGEIVEQVNLIIHHEEFRQLEGSWRGLHHLINNTETDPNRTWPMYGHDPQRTGCSDCLEDLVTAVDPDDPVGGVTRVSFAPPSPNPTCGAATFRFALPLRAAVSFWRTITVKSRGRFKMRPCWPFPRPCMNGDGIHDHLLLSLRASSYRHDCGGPSPRAD